jgi:hypothetical protein
MGNSAYYKRVKVFDQDAILINLAHKQYKFKGSDHIPAVRSACKNDLN